VVPRRRVRPVDGDYEAFETLFDEANEPNEGANGATQSDLRDGLSGFGARSPLRARRAKRGRTPGRLSTNRRRVASQAFDEDRDHLKAFVHDVYLEHIAFALQRNYI